MSTDHLQKRYKIIIFSFVFTELLGENWAQSSQPTGQAMPTVDGWFKAATIAIAVCGFLALLMLAVLAIKLLQPMPSQDEKLNGFGNPECAPPLLPPMRTV